MLDGPAAGNPLRPLLGPVAAQALLHPRDDDARAPVRAREQESWRQGTLTQPAVVHQVDAAGWVSFTRTIILLDGSLLPSLTLRLRFAAVHQVDEAGLVMFTHITPLLLLDGWHCGGWIGSLVGGGFWGMLLEVRSFGAHLDCVMDANLTEVRIL